MLKKSDFLILPSVPGPNVTILPLSHAKRLPISSSPVTPLRGCTTGFATNRMRISTLTRIAGCILALLARVSGQTISVYFSDTTPSIDSVSVSGNSGDAGFSAFDGVANFTETGQSNQLGLFCVEMGQDIYEGTSTPFSILSANQAASILPSDPNFDAASGFEDGTSGTSANIPNSGIGSDRSKNLEILYYHVFGSNYDPASLTSIQIEAFQLAVWKLSQDDAAASAGLNSLTNVSQGAPHFWVTAMSGTQANQNSVFGLAQTWVDFVAENQDAPLMALSVLHNPTVQDFLIPTDNPFIAIPESSTYALFLGFIVLGVAIFRRAIRPASS